MQNKVLKVAKSLHPAKLSDIASYLLKDEAISGKLIIVATLLALIAANTTLRSGYDALWNTSFSIGLGDWVLSKDLRHWVDEALMAIFFLVVGLELKREIVRGELKKFKTATLPFGAAIGGMIVPALIYAGLNLGSDSLRGWAIPMATDIAFAVGILALVGRGIPSSIRLFLLTLAIVDDIGAVIVIALFYSLNINVWMLLAAAAIAIGILLLQKLKFLPMTLFVLAATLMWLAIDASGIHASIAGALVGLLAPTTIKRGVKEPISERLEKFAIPISTLVIIPIFAFANTGIALVLDSFRNDRALEIAGGIILGLVIGKVVGIVGVSWLMIKLRLAELPVASSWNHIIGAGLLAGIGFTVSIFVTSLAFTHQSYADISKISIFAASIISGVAGLLVLKYFPKKVTNNI